MSLPFFTQKGIIMAKLKKNTEEQNVVEKTTPKVEVEEVQVVETQAGEEPVEEPVGEPNKLVEVDETSLDDTPTPTVNAKIRMRENHQCTIAMVRYDFEKGKVYSVPENVKDILNEAGLLLPL